MKISIREALLAITAAGCALGWFVTVSNYSAMAAKQEQESVNEISSMAGQLEDFSWRYETLMARLNGLGFKVEGDPKGLTIINQDGESERIVRLE